MEARAKFLGHPIHQILVHLPLGLLAMATLCDVVFILGWGGQSLTLVSFWNVLAGVGAGLAAAIFGVLDLTAIPRRTRAFRIGVLHGVGNAIAVALFAVAVALRLGSPHAPTVFVLALEVAALSLASVAGWLGGELVDRLGVGVDDHANVNAPSSLRRRGLRHRNGA